MSFLLDTNICSAHLNRPAGLTHRFVQYSGRLYAPTLVLAELYAGAYLRPDPIPLLRKIEFLLDDLQLLQFDAKCAEEFGRLRGKLQASGHSAPAVDLMIAAVAVVHDMTLVTHNTADFCNIPGLRIDDWLVP